MKRLRIFTLAATVLAGIAASTPSSGFVFSTALDENSFTLDSRAAVRWPFGADVVSELQLGAAPGALLDGFESFDHVFLQALTDWHGALEGLKGAPVLYYEPNSTAPKADKNGKNNVFFDSHLYGAPFGARTPAATLWHARDHANGYSIITEADVVFNSAYNWNSYQGDVRADATDLYRAALHELGHVFGLNHPDQAAPPQIVTAIMNSGKDNATVDRLQEDDTRGIRALYSLEAPGPPANATAVASGTVITANWGHSTAGGEPTGYFVEVGAGPGLTSRRELTGTPRPTLSLGGFPPGTYYVRVRGVNWAGMGEPSRESSVTVLGNICNVPGAPTVTVITNTAGTLTLGWTVPFGNPTAYVLYSSRAGSIRDDNLSSATTTDLGNAATATFVGVSPGTIYLRVRAQNACGFGPPSAEIVVTVTAPPPPPPPPPPQDVVYGGRFTGTFTQVYYHPQGTCTWSFRYTGRKTITLRTRADGTITTGTMRITEGMQNAGPGSSSNPARLTCSAQSFSNVNRTESVTGTLSDMRWNDSSWRFTGRQNGSAVTGSMTAIRNDGTYRNTGTISIELQRQ